MNTSNSIKELLNSKRLWSMVIGLVVMIIINLVPALAPNADELNKIIAILVGTLVAGYTVTDSVEATATSNAIVAKAEAAGREAHG